VQIPVHSKCLILSPHQDDEYLGCTALMLRNEQASFIIRPVCGCTGPSKKYPYLKGHDLDITRCLESKIAARHFKNIYYHAGRESYLFRNENNDYITEKEMYDKLTDPKLLPDFNFDFIFTTHYNDKHDEHQHLGKAILQIAKEKKFLDKLYFFFVDKSEAEKSKKWEMDFINKKITLELTKEEIEFKKNIMDIFQTQSHFLPNLVRREVYWYERFYNV